MLVTDDASGTWPADLREVLLDPIRLADWQGRADRLLLSEGAGHLVHDLPVRADGRSAALESRPWRLDPIPYVVGADDFRWLTGAIGERVAALEAVLTDLHGPRHLVAEGTVPSDLIHGTNRYRLAAVGVPPPRRWISTYAVDLVRTVDGAWEVVQDLTDAPPGVGYALLDRSVMSRVGSDLLGRGGVASLARYPTVLRNALAAASPRSSPRTVLFSGGIDHPSYIDHSFLAVQLGVHLVEGADLVVRRRQVWLRTLEGLEPIDVVYRRLEDPGIDPLEVGATGSVGVPGLLVAVRAGGVTLANAHGAGVVEAPELGPSIDAALDELAGGLRMRRVGPGTVAATMPVYRGGLVESGVAVLRMFAAVDGRGVTVMPGGTGRVLAPGDDFALPTECAAKDVWVLGQTVTPLVAAPLPQVDLARSVPTRAADALHWANRSAERAEAITRTLRVVSSRWEQDPGLALLDGGRWASRMTWVVLAVGRRLTGEPSAPATRPDAVLDRLRHALDTGRDAVVAEIGALLTEATTVRDYLSVTTGRVLEGMARRRTALQHGTAAVDDLDGMLADLAAFAGLWNESTVRGPAWLLGDAGRRIERIHVVLDLLGAAHQVGADPRDPVEMLSLEVLLAANESLVAYRRRHRSDVEPAAAFSLLVRDPWNPRSIAACLHTLRRHARDADWPEGAELLDGTIAALGEDWPAVGDRVRRDVEELSRRLVERWFAAPVNPIAVVRRGVDRQPPPGVRHPSYGRILGT